MISKYVDMLSEKETEKNRGVKKQYPEPYSIHPQHILALNYGVVIWVNKKLKESMIRNSH